MTTSGTVGQTTIEVAAIFDHVMRRCGKSPADLNTEVSQTLTNNMFMFLSTLANRGINLWRVERRLFGLYVGQANYSMIDGTLDVLKALYRTPTQLTGTVTSSSGGTVAFATDQDITTILTQSAPAGNVKWDFGSAVPVNCVGLLPGVTSTLTLVFEGSSDATTWVNIKTLGATAFTDGVWAWYDVEPAPSYRYFRIRETSTGTIVMREMFVCQNYNEIAIWRMNRDDYSNMPNKRLPGQPLQFWFDRQLTPQMVMWPTPNTTFSLVSLFSHMQIEDIGAISNTPDIPQRWYDAVIANTAFMSILDIPGADMTRYPILKEQAQYTMQMAEAEERDASPSNFTANISPYTA